MAFERPPPRESYVTIVAVWEDRVTTICMTVDLICTLTHIIACVQLYNHYSMEPIEVKLACLGHALSSQPSPFKEDSQSRTINDTQSNIGRFLLSEEEAGIKFSVTYGLVRHTRRLYFSS